MKQKQPGGEPSAFKEAMAPVLEEGADMLAEREYEAQLEQLKEFKAQMDEQIGHDVEIRNKKGEVTGTRFEAGSLIKEVIEAYGEECATELAQIDFVKDLLPKGKATSK